MPPLAELQETLAEAVVRGDAGRVASSLRGGSDPRARFEIHLRHYEASLVTALHMKFPATQWLVGSELVAGAARAFVHGYPPTRPCIAEYGKTFPAFLARFARGRGLTYLRMFAELELTSAETTTAIELPSLAWRDVAAIGSERLLDCTVRLQPGVRYLKSSWRVDELMKMYLSESMPERFTVGQAQSCIEVRGARGALRIARMERASFAFRAALANGRSIGDSAMRALRYEPSFDAGGALFDLVQTGLVINLSLRPEGVNP